VGPRTSLDTEARGVILLPLPGIEHRSLGRQAAMVDYFNLSQAYAVLFVQSVVKHYTD
jgi:hypothetical protein